jgi:hypothetical protein
VYKRQDLAAGNYCLIQTATGTDHASPKNIYSVIIFSFGFDGLDG